MTLAELTHILEQNYPLINDQAGITYSDAYEVVSAEHQKHQSLYGETPDYQVILNNAVVLLQNGSGHFLILVSVCNAMVQLYKWQGVIEAGRFLERMLSQNWQALYPSVERLKGRAQMVEWLIERLERYFEAHPINSLSLELLDKLLAMLKTLHETLSKCFKGELSLFTLIRPVEDQQRRLQQESVSREAKQKLEAEQRQRETEEAELRKQQNMVQTLEAHAEAVTNDQYLESMDTQSLYELVCARRFRENLVLLEQNPTDLNLYLFDRINTWFAYPYTSQEVANKIDEYDLEWDAYSAALKLYAMGEYEQALIAFESLFQRYPYFLDCQYYIIQCLESIDSEAKLLLNTLTELVQKLAQLYPDLETAATREGIKLCSKQTMQKFEIFIPVPGLNEIKAPKPERPECI